MDEPSEALSQTDGQLVRLARTGDARAFERLVRRHLRTAHAVARRQLGGDDEGAEDVVQDAFVRALERLEDCRDPERFRAWFLTIVRNHAHNWRERERVRRAETLDDVPWLEGGDDPSRRVERRELAEEVGHAVNGLTHLQREVFVLHDMEGADHAEVSATLGISRASSRFNLHVARKALRERLSTVPRAWRR